MCGGENDRGCQGQGDKLTDHGTALHENMISEFKVGDVRARKIFRRQN